MGPGSCLNQHLEKKTATSETFEKQTVKNICSIISLFYELGLPSEIERSLGRHFAQNFDLYIFGWVLMVVEAVFEPQIARIRQQLESNNKCPKNEFLGIGFPWCGKCRQTLG